MPSIYDNIPIPDNWDTGGFSLGDLVKIIKHNHIGKIVAIDERTLPYLPVADFIKYSNRQVLPNELIYCIGDNQGIDWFDYSDLELVFTV